VREAIQFARDTDTNVRKGRWKSVITLLQPILKKWLLEKDLMRRSALELNLAEGLAEREGFEPPVPFRAHVISSSQLTPTYEPSPTNINSNRHVSSTLFIAYCSPSSSIELAQLKHNGLARPAIARSQDKYVDDQHRCAFYLQGCSECCPDRKAHDYARVTADHVPCINPANRQVNFAGVLLLCQSWECD